MLKKKSVLKLLVPLAAGLLSAAVDQPAFAANVFCVPNAVEYYSGTLLIQCGGINYVAVVTPPAGCSSYAQTLDTQKIWLGMAQTALLSKRNLRVYYGTCGGATLLSVVDLWQ